MVPSVLFLIHIQLVFVFSLVLVLRTWILIHVLDLDLSLIPGTFFLFVMFLIRFPRHSP